MLRRHIDEVVNVLSAPNAEVALLDEQSCLEVTCLCKACLSVHGFVLAWQELVWAWQEHVCLGMTLVQVPEDEFWRALRLLGKALKQRV